MNRSFFEQNGASFAWAESGRGLPFVFQHGLGADLEQTFHLFSALPGFRLLAMDSRAHGETPTGDEDRLSFDQFGDDLGAFMQRLGLSRPVVGGLSMGAGIALNFALRYPGMASALVLVRPAWADGPMEARDLYFEVARSIRAHGAKTGKTLFARSASYLGLQASAPDTARSLLSQFDSARAEDGVARLERLPADAPSRSRAAWAHIDVPVLVLAHGGDPVHPFPCAESIAQAIPHSKLVAITPKSASRQKHEQEILDETHTFLTGVAGQK